LCTGLYNKAIEIAEGGVTPPASTTTTATPQTHHTPPQVHLPETEPLAQRQTAQGPAAATDDTNGSTGQAPPADASLARQMIEGLGLGVQATSRKGFGGSPAVIHGGPEGRDVIQSSVQDEEDEEDVDD